MDGLVSFSQLNDFLFCPYSLYLHTLYNNFKSSIYHDVAQTDGTAAHVTVDQSTYKRSGWQTGIWLCSPTYKVYGRCDLYNPTTGELVERKRTIHKLYTGHYMQVWAQAVCLQEMEHPVRKIYLHSITDNTRYFVKLPNQTIKNQLKELVLQISRYTPPNETFSQLPAKCRQCIYAALCPITNLTHKE